MKWIVFNMVSPSYPAIGWTEPRWMALVVLTAATFVSVSAQNLLSNGGFESPGFTSPPFYRYLANGNTAAMTGWTVSNDGVGEQPYLGKLPQYANQVHSGNYGLALNAGSGIRTTFPTRSNTLYTVSFWLKPNKHMITPGTTNAPLAVTVAGYVTNIPSPSQGTWKWMSFHFIAAKSDAAATLKFLNASLDHPPEYFIYNIDDISLAVGPPLRFGCSPVCTSGLFHGSLENMLGRNSTLQASSNLVDWFTLTTLSGASQTNFFADLQTTNVQRFYRAFSP